MIVLTPQELEALTGKPRPSAQKRELAHLGIPFKERRDGTLLVLRVHVEHQQTAEPRRPQLRLNA